MQAPTFAASTPLSESSKARQRVGSTPSAFAAEMYTAGCGLPYNIYTNKPQTARKKACNTTHNNKKRTAGTNATTIFLLFSRAKDTEVMFKL